MIPMVMDEIIISNEWRGEICISYSRRLLDIGTTVGKVKEQDAFITTRNGTKHQRETTKGVEELVQ